MENIDPDVIGNVFKERQFPHSHLTYRAVQFSKSRSVPQTVHNYTAEFQRCQ